MADPQKIIRWETPEYVWKPKTIDWFWVLGIIAIATSITAVALGNALFGVFILLGAGLLAYFSIHRPEIVTIEANNKGIRVKETIYPYRNIDAFWIDNEKNDNQLLIMTRRFFSPLLSIPLADAPHEELRELLLEHVEERELTEAPAHKVLEMLGL